LIIKRLPSPRLLKHPIQTLLLIPTLPKERDPHPTYPYDRSNNAICRFLASPTPSKRQPQPTIDESERDDRARSPHVDMPNDGPALVLAESHVLQHAAESDQPDSGEGDEADDCVGGV
jgi:hypothetical protein